MSSHGQIFKSSVIIGGASLINIIVGVTKVKILAMLLGPSGVGLMGLFQNIMGVASTVTGCGISNSGVRQLAASGGIPSIRDLVRRTLWLSGICLGTLGMLLVWLLRDFIAEKILGDIAYANEIGWLGVGVFLTLLASSQSALLQGMRKIADLASVKIVGGVLSAGTGILLVYSLGKSGVLWFVLTAPAAGVLVAAYYAAKLPKPTNPANWRDTYPQWVKLITLGFPFMLAGLLTLLTQLIARSLIVEEMGLNASGYFQAAWSISMTYMAVILGAMGADFYPRLTSVINKPEEAFRLLDEQTEMALLMAAPILLAMITLAPWAIHILYAPTFAPATDVLRWQMLGNILKIISWPLGFIILALGRGKIYIFTELAWNVSYLAILLLGLERYGLVVTGIGFTIAYLVYYCVLSALAFKLIKYKQARRNLLYGVALIFASSGIIFCSSSSLYGGYIVGIPATVILSVLCIVRLDKFLNFRTMIKRRFSQ